MKQALTFFISFAVIARQRVVVFLGTVHFQPWDKSIREWQVKRLRKGRESYATCCICLDKHPDYYSEA